MNSIVFFGTEDFSLVALKALVEAGFPVAAVVTKPDSPKGRGHLVTEPIVKQYAKEHKITVWQPNKVKEINAEIVKLNQPVGVLVSYGKILPQETLDLFTPGIINVHPSLLPKLRGPSPIESAILSGDQETGVSIMRLTAAMDAGPIYKQVHVALNGKETSEQLYDELGKMGADLLVEILPSIVDDSLLPYDQDDDSASYSKLLKKDDGVINWNDDARSIEARIRAYCLWPKSRTSLGKIEVIITNAEVVDGSEGTPGTIILDDYSGLTITAAQGSIRINTLKPIGKKEMPVSAFLSGYRSQLEL
jgi:methionyl-tRNA formyltransferase